MNTYHLNRSIFFWLQIVNKYAFVEPPPFECGLDSVTCLKRVEYGRYDGTQDYKDCDFCLWCSLACSLFGLLTLVEAALL